MKIDEFEKLLACIRHGMVEEMNNILGRGTPWTEVWSTEGMCEMLVMAAAYGQLAAVEILLDHGVPADWEPGSCELCPVMAAAITNRGDIVDALLKKGGRPNTTWNSDVVQGLSYAIGWGNLPMVASLLAHGAIFELGIHPQVILSRFPNEEMERFFEGQNKIRMSATHDELEVQEGLQQLERHIRDFDFSDVEGYVSFRMEPATSGQLEEASTAPVH